MSYQSILARNVSKSASCTSYTFYSCPSWWLYEKSRNMHPFQTLDRYWLTSNGVSVGLLLFTTKYIIENNCLLLFTTKHIIENNLLYDRSIGTRKRISVQINSTKWTMLKIVTAIWNNNYRKHAESFTWLVSSKTSDATYLLWWNYSC